MGGCGIKNLGWGVLYQELRGWDIFGIKSRSQYNVDRIAVQYQP